MINMKKPVISVIVAAFNVERYIEKCVKSIMKQTYSNIEIIVVDDCSRDKTGLLCDKLAKTDDRVVCVHHKENKRQPGARNTGIEMAKGEYIAFVDGDDWLAEDCIDYLYTVAMKTGADMAISCSNFTSRDMKQTRNDSIEIWSPEMATASFLYSKIAIGAWNKLYRREFIEQNNLRFKDLFTAEGFRFISDCSQRCNKVAVGHRRVYYYRLNNPKSATTFPDVRQGLGALQALDGIERDLIIKTEDINKSIRHHRLINKFYTLRLIIERKARGEYYKDYRECLLYIKKNGITISLESYEKKLLLKSLFPIAACYWEIVKKKWALKKDKEA